LENDPQLKHRNFFRRLNHPEVGKYTTLGTSFQLSKAPYKMKRSPTLGEHTEQILKEILGMSDDDIVQLAVEGALD
ncbi:CoA transferase, partial [Chloroflexota bacterium]